jgi:hypothetical protein
MFVRWNRGCAHQVRPPPSVLVRFSSCGYVWSMECSLASGTQVPDTRVEDSIDWLGNVLSDWIIDGADDVPEP